MAVPLVDHLVGHSDVQLALQTAVTKADLTAVWRVARLAAKKVVLMVVRSECRWAAR